jgi:uncharacterized phiE125 gp8 family phage protein
MAVNIVTAPTIEPVSLEEAKAHVRVDIAADDALIRGLVVAARQMAETITRRALCTQTWDYLLDEFPGEDQIYLPFPPLQSVTSVKYTDEDDDESTFSSSSYLVDAYSEPGRIRLKSGYSWPGDTLRVVNGVAVRFVCGYGEPGDVPDAIKSAMLLMIGHWYENREAATVGAVAREVPLGVEALLWPYRVVLFP